MILKSKYYVYIRRNDNILRIINKPCNTAWEARQLGRKYGAGHVLKGSEIIKATTDDGNLYRNSRNPLFKLELIEHK